MADVSWSISDSVMRVKERFGPQEVTTAEVLNALFEIHPEYGNDLAANVRLTSPPDAARQTVHDILEAARIVWDSPPHLLHGRLLVVSLALQDPQIGQQLAEAGLLQALAREYTDMPPVQVSLEGSWKSLLTRKPSATPPPSAHEPWHPDDDPGRVLQAAYELAGGQPEHPVTPLELRGKLWRRGFHIEDIVPAIEANLAADPPLMARLQSRGTGPWPETPQYVLTWDGVERVEGRVREARHSSSGGGSAPPEPVTLDDTSAPQTVIAAANERVPLHADHPATVDQLGRRPFAEIIARRLEENRLSWQRLEETGEEDADRALMVGIHGPWGAGKTTVLNLLRAHLQGTVENSEKQPKDGAARPADAIRGREDRWVVIDFNAWRHQRIRPPWWTLIQAVYAGSVRQIGFWRALVLRTRWLMWRLRADWLPALAAVALIAVAVIFTTGVLEIVSSPSASTQATGGGPDRDAMGKAIELGLKIITAVLAAGAAVAAFSRSLLFGSSRAAQAYTEMRSSDPLRPIVRLFSRLVKAVGRPVAVFVDDLDRCDAKYVVELLEGMQTLFRTVPIAYVVAADRKWIAASFGKGYEDFNGAIGEPGRPLGYLFLDKLFQLSAALPLLSAERKREYWASLLRASGSADPEKMEEARKDAEKQAEQIIGGASTHEALSSAIASHEHDPLLQEGLRAVAAKRITSRAAERETAHRLQPFDELLESNPRSMKRLVNAYGLHQAAQYIETGGVRPETLARWTIVELRWPLLADYLLSRPAAVTKLRERKAPDGLPIELTQLFADDVVHAVVTGTGPDDPGLDEDAIRRIVGRPPAPRASTSPTPRDEEPVSPAAGAEEAAETPEPVGAA